MTYEMYTYGNGEMMSDILNGISSLVNNPAYSPLIAIGVCVGFASLLLTTAFDLKLNRTVKWYAMIMMLYTALIYPKETVLINDVAVPVAPRVVDGVPVGLAFLLSFFTGIEYQLTKALETIFHIPDDVSYSRTGMMMASDMVRKSSSFKIQNPDFSQNLQSFIHQCVQYDILHGKYPIKELFNHGNIWEFVKSNASQARAFMYNDDIVTCAEGSKKLSDDWDKELRDYAMIFGVRMFGNRPQESPEILFTKYLEAGYRHLADLSSGASEIMRQTMMINAYYDSVSNNAAELDAAAAIENYAVAKAIQSSRSAYKISGEVAGRLLPYIKNTIQLLLVGAFIILLPLFFLSSGAMRIKHYVEILASLSLWGPLYAILNMQMTGAGRWKIYGLASEFVPNKHAAITIANLSGIEQVAADQMILAGYLALSVPLIAYGLIKSSMYAFTTLASGMMGASQSSVGAVAEESATGNYTLGEISLDNTNIHNTSTFQDHTMIRVPTDATQVDGMNGEQITYYAGGNVSVDNSHAASKFLNTLNFGSELENEIRQSYNSTVETLKTQGLELNNVMEGAYQNVYELAKILGGTTSSGEQYSQEARSHEEQAMRTLVETVDSIAHKTGVSSDDVMSVAAKVKVGADLSVVGFETEAGYSHSVTSSKEDEIRQELSQTEGFETLLNTVTSQAAEKTYATQDHASNQLSDTIRADLRKADALGDSISANFHQSERKEAALEYLDKKSASINTDASRMIMDTLQNSTNPETGQHYTANEISAMDMNHPDKFKRAIQPIIEDFAQDIIQMQPSINDKEATLRQNNDANRADIHDQAKNIPVTFDVSKQNIETKSDMQTPVDQMKNNVNDKIADDKKAIAKGEGRSKAQDNR